MRRTEPHRSTCRLRAEAHELTGLPSSRDDLACCLGYASVPDMMEQTEFVQSLASGCVYLTPDPDGYWAIWNDGDYRDIQRFESRLSALLAFREGLDLIDQQS